MAAAESARTSGWRAWMGRAVFESALIVFGILAGLAVNEWQAGRDRAARASDVLSTIRSEVESNLKLLDEANAYNAEIVAKLRALVAAKSKTIPPGTYPHGLMSKPQLVSAAWTSAQTAGVLNDLPIETVLLLGRAYESQRDYLNEMSTLLNNLYAGALQGQANSDLDPDRIDGVLSDFAAHGRSVANRYRAALEPSGALVR
jgi:type II secretory pathway pseudopilin PulG